MGNCTSKKSAKSLKLSAGKKPLFHSKMDKEQDAHIKGLSKKVAPFTKGEITSFGFKKKPPSQLPIPVTLTSNGHTVHETNDKMVQNGSVEQKTLSDGYQSGSSVESLCHAPFRSTPKMIRKRDLVRQQIASNTVTERERNSFKANNNVKDGKSTFQTTPTSLGLHNENNNSVVNNNNNYSTGTVNKVNFEPTVNRFGFRQPTPPRTSENLGKSLKNNGVTQVSRTAFITGQGPYDTGSYSTNKKTEISARSKSEGPREAFFKQTLQPSNSVQSGLNQSKTSLTNLQRPGKFTFQTSHLPRPQFPVRMPDTKTAKTAANYHRRGGGRNDSYSSKEGSLNEDSGFESHTSANNTLERNIEILESSPGCKVRRRLPAFRGKKLEMKIVGNKFELLKKDEETSPDVVTEVSLIKLPSSNIRTSTAIINTGLVEQRTNQYLRKISQSYNNMNSDVGLKDANRLAQNTKATESSDSNNGDEGLGAESEEEKLFKDSRRSEKISDNYLMSDGCGDEDDMLPGEALAEDVSLCLSFEEDTKETCSNMLRTPVFQSESNVTPNTIRIDALKLSKELKYKNSTPTGDISRKGENSSLELLLACDKDEEIFPSDSILEQLSSDSDSLGDKGENKNNDKEKNLKIANMNLDKEDLGIDLDEEGNNMSQSNTDVEDNDIELNMDENEIKDEHNNCLGSTSPDSPGTPTHASNSLSLSDGRDFLIDDEIADQPQLCFSENYVDISCQEEVKTSNEKTLTTMNNEFVTCSDVNTQTMRNEEEAEEIENVDEIQRGETENILKPTKTEGRCQRLNSEGTLSPCESIASDDLMLDFESNSFEENSGRFEFVNENISLENMNISMASDKMKESPIQKHSVGSGGGKLGKVREGSSGCSTPASVKSFEIVSRGVSSPLKSSRSTPANDDSIKLDKVSYQTMFQDIVSIKSMLLKLKRLLSESEGGLLENGRICLENGTIDNIVEDELTDLRRQVLFLQQQLEEREKMVQVLRLEINKSSGPGTPSETTESRKQSNAATQTGLDQFQQDFPHFRIFQTTPVV